MLRIAVVGNCQATGIAKGLAALSSQVEATGIFFGSLKSDAEREAHAEGLGGFDLILSHDINQAKYGPLTAPALAARYRRVVRIPSIDFSGLHPDWQRLRRGPQPLNSPVGEYHSAIVAAAFANGLPPGRVMGLFNSYIFARLGYFDEFERGREFLVSRAAGQGYDLADDFERAAGVFMHTRNHPSIPVLVSLARRIAQKLDIAIDRDGSGVSDDLGRKLRLPVYPPLAGRHSATGGWVIWRGRDHAAESAMELPMAGYIAKAYRMYRQLPRNVWAQPDLQPVRKVLAEEVV